MPRRDTGREPNVPGGEEEEQTFILFTPEGREYRTTSAVEANTLRSGRGYTLAPREPYDPARDPATLAGSPAVPDAVKPAADPEPERAPDPVNADDPTPTADKD